MAVALVQSNAGNTGTTTPSSLDATLPGAPTSGNTLLLAVSSDATVATPSGWTKDREQVNNNGHYLFRKVATGAETSVTVTPSVGASTAWVYIELSGVATDDPLAGTTSTGSGSGSDTRNTGSTGTTTGAAGGIAVATFGLSLGSAGTGTTDTYNNSFTEVSGADTVTTKVSGTNVSCSMATRAVEADAAFACTATFSLSAPSTGIIAVYRPAAGGTDHEATGTLTVTATRAGAGAIAKLFKTLHKDLDHAPASRADMETAFSPNTASGGWHRGDGAHPIHGNGWSLYCFNDFFVSDGAGGVQAFFRRNSVLMVDHDDGEVWWLSSGDGFGLAGSVTFPWPADKAWAWLRGGWATGDTSCILIGDIYNANATLHEHRVMAVTGLTGTAPPYTVTHPCGLDTTANWQGSPVVVDGYAYIYGLEGLTQVLARAEVTTDVTAYGPGGWEYWTGSGWSTTYANRGGIVIQSAPLRALTFIAWNGRYLAAAKDFDSSPEIGTNNTDWTELKVWVADAPTGPWKYHGIVYDTEVTDWWSYTARAELLPGMTDLSVIWSINTDIDFDADLYGPVIAAPNQVGRLDFATALDGTAVPTRNVAGNTSATATAAGTATKAAGAASTVSVAATITGAASVTRPATSTTTITAAATGTATVTAPAAGDLAVTATTASGAGTLARSATGQQTATATTAGTTTTDRGAAGDTATTATITGAAAVTLPVAGDLAATATTAGAGTVAAVAAGNLATTATRAAAGLRTAGITGTRAATATIAGAGDIPGSDEADGNLPVTAAAAGTATADQTADATLALTATTTGTGTGTHPASGSLATTADIVGATQVAHPADGNTTATATTAGAAGLSQPATGQDLEATAALTGTATVTRLAAGNLNLTVTTTAVGSLESEPGAGDLAVTATLTGTGQATHPATGSQATTASLVGTATVAHPAGSTRTVTATITGSAGIVRGTAGATAATATITGAATTESAPVVITPPHGAGPLDDIQGSDAYDPATQVLTVSGVANGAVSSVEVTVDDDDAGTATGTATWTIQISTATWAPGPHTIVATAHLTAGGTAAPYTITVWHAPTGMYGAAPVAGDHLIPIAFAGA